MDLDLDFLRGVFIAESEEGLANMEQALMQMESRPGDVDALAAIFRTVHTIKGSSAMVGLEHLSEFAHLLEDALSLARDGRMSLTPVHVTILLQAVDVLRSMVHAAAEGRLFQIRAADRQLVLRLLPDDVRAAKELELQRADMAREAEAEGGTGSAGEHDVGAPSRVSSARGRSLRVDMRKLDEALSLVGEITVSRSRLWQALRDQGAAFGPDVGLAAEDLDRLLSLLQEDVMQLRLVPLGPSFRQHLRTVRDVAANVGKLAKLVLAGEDVEVDAAVVEQLRDPLMHMVRNAIDHGLEYPAARRDTGKDPVGTITLSARHDGGNVVIDVSDDGAGLDREKILARARERGIVSDGEAMTDNEVWNLVTLPGFSTADRVTELSGRGVGMDVVRANVEALRGTLQMLSRPGRGTTIRIRLPLTLAIIRGFAVTARDVVYVIPLDSVTECLSMPDDERAEQRAEGVLNVRGEMLPYLRLRDCFGADGRPAAARENVVVVHDNEGRAGLVVEELRGEMEAVIKPLGRLFEGLPGVSGSTIMGDGRVALILDVPSLLARARAANAATAPGRIVA